VRVEVSEAVAEAIEHWEANGHIVKYEGKFCGIGPDCWILVTPSGREVGMFGSDLLLTGETWD